MGSNDGSVGGAGGGSRTTVESRVKVAGEVGGRTVHLKLHKIQGDQLYSPCVSGTL